MDDSLPARLHAVASERPDAAALTCKNDRWTYLDLRNAMQATASFLQRNGCASGDRIALLFRNCPQYVAAYYGVLAAGCVAVPLNFHEHAHVLGRHCTHCGARLLIGDPGHPAWGAILECLGTINIGVMAISARDEAKSNLEFLDSMGGVGSLSSLNMSADGPAIVMYTSGTTGRPKGVMLNHGSLAANTSAIIKCLGLSPSDRGMAVLPFQFAYGSSVLHTHLAVGAELLLEESFAFPHAVLERMVSAGATGFAGVPSTYAILLSRCDLSAFDLGKLRYVTQAGGPMPAANVERLRRCLPNARLFIMYGQTEAAARLSCLPPERLDDKLGSVGVAIPGVELAILRADGTRAGCLEQGEVVARGPNIMSGYLDDPEETKKVIRDGWLHTGDLGRMDEEGYLYIDGRAVEMIKVGAYRVSPQEVEEVIAALPGVAEVGVTAVPDDLLSQAIKAVVVLRDGQTVDARTVRAHCRRHLALYKVPKHVHFALALPRTPTGKVQRTLLA
jgi:acyl-CoA synthetase (AMP-forming)/AMP-acid ligase II